MTRRQELWVLFNCAWVLTNYSSINGISRPYQLSLWYKLEYTSNQNLMTSISIRIFWRNKTIILIEVFFQVNSPSPSSYSDKTSPTIKEKTKLKEVIPKKKFKIKPAPSKYNYRSDLGSEGTLSRFNQEFPRYNWLEQKILSDKSLYDK